MLSGCKFLPLSDEEAGVEPDKSETEDLNDLKEKIDKLSGKETIDEDEEEVDEEEDEVDEEEVDKEELEEEVKKVDKEEEDEVKKVELVEVKDTKSTYKGENLITVDNPSNKITISKEPVQFKGTVSPNVTKIVVTQTYADDLSIASAADIYELKNFKAGDEEFSYGASRDWDNLNYGENYYEFKAYFEDGSTKTTNRTLTLYYGDNTIKVTSPTNAQTFQSGPIEFKGNVSPSATKIVVTASGGNDSYTDVYQLKDYENGDDTFVYRAGTDWGNLATGNNTYQFDAYFDDGSVKTDLVEISYLVSGGGVVTTEFDGCGKMSKYAGKDWYSSFTNSVAYLVAQGYNNEVQEMCYSSNDNLVIGLVSGDYCAVGKAFKYETDTKKLAVASFTNVGEGCYGQMTEFGKRSGNIIPITGVFGDAGYAATYYYDYNFISNKITLKKSYGYNADEGEDSGEWTYY